MARAHALFLLAVAGAVLSGSGSLETEVVVGIHAESTGFAGHGWYAPRHITVRRGTVVRWINRDVRHHSVRSVAGLFDSGLIEPGGSWAHRFESAGEYAYECHWCFCNPMRGAVVVTP